MASHASVFDFINTYLLKVKTTPSTFDLCSVISKRMDVCFSQWNSLLSDSLLNDSSLKENENENLLENESHLAQGTSLLDGLSLFLQLKSTLIHLQSELTYTMDPLYDTLCDLFLKEDFHFNWNLRFHFDHAKLRFLDSILNFTSLSLDVPLQEKQEQKQEEKKKQKNCQIVFKIFNLLLPGDEYLISKYLHSFLLDSKELSTDRQKSRRMLLDIYDTSMYDDTCLTSSASMYKRDTKEIQGCMIQVSNKSLPLPKDWIYSPLDLFLNEEKNKIHVCWDDMNGILLELLEFLLFSVHVDCVYKRDDLGRVFKLFLLSSAEGEDFFHDLEIQIKLETLLNTFSLEIKDAHSDSSSRFYQLYLECLDHYAATSYGNKTFGKYLMILLGMHYPKDYRVSFWTVLEPCLSLFTHSIQEMPGGMDLYLGKEDDLQLLKLYKRVVLSGKITLESCPALYTIASHHVSLESLELNVNE